MTSADFGAEEAQGQGFPTVFGISLPLLLGVLIGAAGLGGAFWWFTSVVQPEQANVDGLQADVDGKRATLQDKQGNVKRVKEAEAKLAAAKQRKLSVEALFASPETMETFLMDFTREFDNRRNEGIRLLNFGIGAPPTLVTDSSLGQAVNNKLQRQEFSISMEANYAKTVDVLRRLELLQPLLVVKNLTSQRDNRLQRLRVDRQGKATLQGEPLLTTNFTLQSIISIQAPPSPAPSPADGAPPPKK